MSSRTERTAYKRKGKKERSKVLHKVLKTPIDENHAEISAIRMLSTP